MPAISVLSHPTRPGDRQIGSEQVQGLADLTRPFGSFGPHGPSRTATLAVDQNLITHGSCRWYQGGMVPASHVRKAIECRRSRASACHPEVTLYLRLKSLRAGLSLLTEYKNGDQVIRRSRIPGGLVSHTAAVLWPFAKAIQTLALLASKSYCSISTC